MTDDRTQLPASQPRLGASGRPNIERIASDLRGPLTIDGAPGFLPAIEIFGPPVPLPKLVIPYELSTPPSLAMATLALERETALVLYVAAKDGEAPLPELVRGVGCVGYIRQYETAGERLRIVVEYDRPVRVAEARAFGDERYILVDPIAPAPESDPEEDLERADELARSAFEYLERKDEQRARALRAMETMPQSYRSVFTSYAVASMLEIPAIVKLEVLSEPSSSRRNAMVEAAFGCLTAAESSRAGSKG